MDLDNADKYDLYTVKIRNNVKWIVKNDSNNNKKWYVLNVIDDKLDNPSRYGLRPFDCGLGKRYYGINKTKWKVVYEKSKNFYEWKMIEKDSAEEKERLLEKIKNKLSDYMHIYGEPEEIDLESNHSTAKILFDLKCYGVIFLKHTFEQEIINALQNILTQVSLHLFNAEDPRENKNFLKKCLKLKKIYSDYDDLQINFIAISSYINTNYGFKNNGDLRLEKVKNNKFNFVASNDDKSYLIYLNTNLFHKSCTQLMSSSNLWKPLKDISFEYFVSHKDTNFMIDYPHLLPSTSNFTVQYYDLAAKNTKIQLTPFTLPNEQHNNDYINVLFTKQQPTSIHLGFILFTNLPDVKKLINKYLTNTTNINRMQFNSIIMKYWRALGNGVTIYSSNTCFYEAIPHNTSINKKILLRNFLQKQDLGKLSFRFNMQISAIVPHENMELLNKIKLCYFLENGFEITDIINDFTKEYFDKNYSNNNNKLRKITKHEKKSYHDIIDNLNLDNIEKKIASLHKDIKEMYGIYI